MAWIHKFLYSNAGTQSRKQLFAEFSLFAHQAHVCAREEGSNSPLALCPSPHPSLRLRAALGTDSTSAFDERYPLAYQKRPCRDRAGASFPPSGDTGCLAVHRTRNGMCLAHPLFPSNYKQAYSVNSHSVKPIASLRLAQSFDFISENSRLKAGGTADARPRLITVESELLFRRSVSWLPA